MARSVGVIALGNLVSKCVGLLREVAFAAWFGTGEVAAAFRVAQTAYLLPTQALVGDSLGAGLLPLYKMYKAHDELRARVLVAIASLYALLFSVVVTTLLYLFAENLASIIAPGVSLQVLMLAAGLLKIMALATPFYVLSGMLSYIEAAYGRFGAIAWRPILLNLGSIAGAALAVWIGKDQWLAIGLLLSHVLFFVLTVFNLCRLDKVWPAQVPVWSVFSSVSQRFISNLIPLLGLPFVTQLNGVVERIVSSQMGTASIPSVDYARFMCDTSVQLIAVPLGILTMSIYGGGVRCEQEVRRHVQKVTQLVLLVSFPISVYFVVNAEPLVAVLFARGAFDAKSVALTSSILAWMGGALGLTITSYYLVRAMNAQLRNREVLFFTAIACTLNSLINWLGWRHFGIKVVGIGVAGYAVTLFVLCVWAMGIFGQIRRMIPVLLIMLLMQFVGIYALKLFIANPVVELIVSFAVMLSVVALFVKNNCILRDAAQPILDKFPSVWFFRK
jgi:putative peptidoglycan lipid II flippase